MAENNPLVPPAQIKQFSTQSETGSQPQSTSLISPVLEEPLVSSPTRREIALRLVPLFVLASVALLWATLDEIPIEVVGRSILIIPSNDLEIQSRAAGKVLKVHVNSGNTVKAGQLLVTLDLPEVRETLLTQQQKLAQLQKENQAVTNVEVQRTQLKRETLQQRKESLQREIGSLGSQYEANLRQIEAHQIKIEANTRQLAAYQQRIEQLQEINRLISKRLKAFEQLVKEGVVAALSPDLILIIQAEQNNQNTITTLRASLEDIQADDEQQQAEIKKLKAENQGLIAKIDNQKAGLAGIKTQNRQQDLDDIESNFTRTNKITDQQRAIANTKAKLATESRIFSDYNGKILDIAVNSSQYVKAGTRVGTLQITPADHKILGLSFFQIGDADRIDAKMPMEIVPNIQRRERYGGIVATVLAVSQETVTPQEVASLVGSEELAKELTNGQPTVQITAELHRDPNNISGYQWTQGEGAPQKIPNGTTANSRVQVERRSLMSYIIPALRRITGIYSR